MYTLSQIRSGINALRRKYAKELAIYRLRQLAEELCDQWAAAVARQETGARTPHPHPAGQPGALQLLRLYGPAPLPATLPPGEPLPPA